MASDDDLDALVRAVLGSSVDVTKVTGARAVLLRYYCQAMEDWACRERTVALARHLAAGHDNVPVTYSQDDIKLRVDQAQEIVGPTFSEQKRPREY